MINESYPLPIYHHVTFVDWHGVLSQRLFWSSLSRTQRNSLGLDAMLNDFFEVSTAKRWMLGQCSTLDLLNKHVDEPTSRDLFQVVIQETRRARLNATLMRRLEYLRRASFIVIATDNMDCFSEALRLRRGSIGTFDDVLISSEIGALKRDPEAFFGPWLHAMNMRFDQATLIDDDEQNIEAFRNMGGDGWLYR